VLSGDAAGEAAGEAAGDATGVPTWDGAGVEPVSTDPITGATAVATSGEATGDDTPVTGVPTTTSGVLTSATGVEMPVTGVPVSTTGEDGPTATGDDSPATGVPAGAGVPAAAVGEAGSSVGTSVGGSVATSVGATTAAVVAVGVLSLSEPPPQLTRSKVLSPRTPTPKARRIPVDCRVHVPINPFSFTRMRCRDATLPGWQRVNPSAHADAAPPAGHRLHSHSNMKATGCLRRAFR